MKRTIGMLVCMAVLLALCACGRLGDVNGVKTHRVPSEMYTQEEIDAAIDVVKARFKKDYGGCVLLELTMPGMKQPENLRAGPNGTMQMKSLC